MGGKLRSFLFSVDDRRFLEFGFDFEIEMDTGWREEGRRRLVNFVSLNFSTFETKFRSNLFTTIFLSFFLRHFSTMYSLLFPRCRCYGTREIIRNFKKNRVTLNFSSGTGRTKGDLKLLSSLPSFRQTFLLSFHSLLLLPPSRHLSYSR